MSGAARRWIDELSARPDAEAAARATGALEVAERDAVDDEEEEDLRAAGLLRGMSAVRVRYAAAAEDTGRSLDEGLAEGSADVVVIDRGVYTTIPTREARVTLLARARRAARVAVVVHVPVVDEGTYLARLAFDVPRALLRAVGLPAAERGDRAFAAQASGPPGFVHCFFDEEALLGELRAAGLDVAARKGFTFALRPLPPGAVPHEDAAPFATEVFRVLRLVRFADRIRAQETPERAVDAMRQRGDRACARGPVGRARLRRAIGWVDAGAPGGASCYRRILLELGLDAGAAGESIVFGLDVGRTGHVAFKDREERAFDVAFEVPPKARP